MEGRNGLLTLAVYLTVTTLIAVAVFVGILRYGPSQPVTALPVADPLPELAVAQRQTPVEPPAVTPTATGRGMDQQRLRLLETMLEEKTHRLQSQTQQLDQRTAELAELQARYDEVVALMLDAFSHGVDPGHDSDASQQAGASDPDAAPSAEALAAELAAAREAHQALAEDITVLQDGLVLAQRELADLREMRERERSEHVREQQMLEAAAASVLMRVGAESVPALSDLLDHPLPSVRRWAALMLSSLGPDAYEAVPALRTALSDNDALVRAAVQAALSAIER